MPTVTLDLGERSYQVIVENGILHKLGDELKRLSIKGSIALITDSNVAPLYAETACTSLSKAGFRTSLHLFEAGEINKNLSTVERLSNEMVAKGHDRSSTVVALGGGVVGDLAGFLASIYYRGIPFIQVATTIMAQVDSSVGGKTAVDIAAGKNLIGAFHQPKLVLIDPQTLLSLPQRVLVEGMAEMVKHAAIAQGSMLNELKSLGQSVANGRFAECLDTLPELLAANIAIKARIVEADEKETLGLRAFLNLGHTIGHGIEASVPYGDLLHGEVVSLGMRAAIYLSCKYVGLSQDTATSILNTLHALALPLELPQGVDPRVALTKTASDKKFEAGAIRFVLLQDVAKPVLSRDIKVEDLADALQELTKPYQAL